MFRIFARAVSFLAWTGRPYEIRAVTGRFGGIKQRDALTGVIMKFDPNKHHRRSIRLQGYDYSQAGAYFVTMVTQNRACLFGEIAGSEMRLNAAGEMVEKWWFELEPKYPTVALGAYVIMPNHFHGIICIVGVDLRVDPELGGRISGGHAGPPLPDVDP
jgi:hypothetical protein